MRGSAARLRFGGRAAPGREKRTGSCLCGRRVEGMVSASGGRGGDGMGDPEAFQRVSRGREG